MKRLYAAICSLLEVKAEKFYSEMRAAKPRESGPMAKSRGPIRPASETWGEPHHDHHDTIPQPVSVENILAAYDREQTRYDTRRKRGRGIV